MRGCLAATAKFILVDAGLGVTFFTDGYRAESPPNSKGLVAVSAERTAVVALRAGVAQVGSREPFGALPRQRMGEVNHEAITMQQSTFLAAIMAVAGLVAVASPATSAQCSPGYQPAKIQGNWACRRKMPKLPLKSRQNTSSKGERKAGQKDLQAEVEKTKTDDQ